MLLACALLLIAFATLWPMPGEPEIRGFCMLCGGRGTADLLLNVVLFMPLGVAFSRRGHSRTRIFLLALLLSTTIELVQFFIPGRDPSVSDVFANTCGAVLGALVASNANSWLASRAPPALVSRLCRTASVLAVLMCLITGLLLNPAYPDSAYFSLWTPDLGHLVPYRGRVLSATLDGEPIGDGPIHASDRIRAALEAPDGFALEVRAIAGPEPDGLSPLFAIFDEQRREILLLGQDREDLVLRLRSRANDARLDRPELRVRAGAWRQADTVSVSILARAGRYWINGVAAGFTVGSGWGLFLYMQHLPFKSAVNAAWIAVLFVPAAFWARTRADAAIVVVGIVAGLALVPAWTTLQPTPPAQWLATAGICLAAVRQRHHRGR
jgi:glycopeptide antibiotics resistance protein